MRGCLAVGLVSPLAARCRDAAALRELPAAIRERGHFLGQIMRFDSRRTQSTRFKRRPAQVERASGGGKLTPAQRADVDKYNDLLNQYLGARCHV